METQWGLTSWYRKVSILPLCEGNHWWILLTKIQWCGGLFPMLLAWINRWTNTRGVDNFRRSCDVKVMRAIIPGNTRRQKYCVNTLLLSNNTAGTAKKYFEWLFTNETLSNNDLCNQGCYSLCGKTFYREISRSLEAARLGVIMIVSLWNLPGISQAVLPMCLSNIRAIGKVKTESRGFETSRDLVVRRPSA